VVGGCGCERVLLKARDTASREVRNVRRRDGFLVAMGALAGVIAVHYARRAVGRAKERTGTFARPAFVNVGHVLEWVRDLWRHPERLAMMRSNPAISGALSDAVLAALLQHGADEAPALADRVLAWLSLRGDALRKDQPTEPVAVSPAQERSVAEFARETLVRGARPNLDHVDALIDAFGVRTAHDVVTFVRLVAGIVLAANTWEAIVSRALGRPSPETRARDEAKIVSLLALAILPLVPIAYLRTVINPAG